MEQVDPRRLEDDRERKMRWTQELLVQVWAGSLLQKLQEALSVMMPSSQIGSLTAYSLELVAIVSPLRRSLRGLVAGWRGRCLFLQCLLLLHCLL